MPLVAASRQQEWGACAQGRSPKPPASQPATPPLDPSRPLRAFEVLSPLLLALISPGVQALTVWSQIQKTSGSPHFFRVRPTPAWPGPPLQQSLPSPAHRKLSPDNPVRGVAPTLQHKPSAHRCPVTEGSVRTLNPWCKMFDYEKATWISGESGREVRWRRSLLQQSFYSTFI